MTHEFQINRNGDTPDTLKKEFIAVMNAARELTAALQAVTVNGRRDGRDLGVIFIHNVRQAAQVGGKVAHDWFSTLSAPMIAHIE